MRKICYVYDVSFHLDQNGNSKIAVKKLNQIALDRSVSYAEIHDGRLILGHQASFVSYPCIGGSEPAVCLVNSEDKTLHFLQTEVAMCAIPLTKLVEVSIDQQSTSDNSSNQMSGLVPQYEYLLCFKRSAVYAAELQILERLFEEFFWLNILSTCFYVDAFTGQRLRQFEIQFPTPAEHICHNEHLGALLVFTTRGIDVFSIQNGEWVQTIPIKNAKPLNSFGRLIVATDASGQAKFLYLRKNPKSSGSLEISWFKPSFQQNPQLRRSFNQQSGDFEEQHSTGLQDFRNYYVYLDFYKVHKCFFYCLGYFPSNTVRPGFLSHLRNSWKIEYKWALTSLSCYTLAVQKWSRAEGCWNHLENANGRSKFQQVNSAPNCIGK